MPLLPRKPVPSLEFDTVGGSHWSLAAQNKPDATLYWASVSTMPFARPHFTDIAGTIDFAVGKNYPARGEA